MQRFLWIGFAVWLIATIALRLFGQFLFREGASLPILFGVTALAIAVPISLLVRRIPTREAGLRYGVALLAAVWASGLRSAPAAPPRSAPA